MSYKFPTVYAPHGGGPWPVIELEMMDNFERVELANYMKSIAMLPKQKPKALLVISAHWEEEQFTINMNKKSELLFDYFGFPDEAYNFKWQAPVDLNLNEEVQNHIDKGDFVLGINSERGLDHGVFIPLLLAYPEPDIPVIQLSLKKGLDPSEHIEFGRALTPLREQGYFILGSGNSYHNLNYMFNPTTKPLRQAKVFDDWLRPVCESANNRSQKLIDWELAPEARNCHPREEHFIPLLVVAGAAENEPGHVTWRGTTHGLAHSAFHFGLP